MIKKWSMSYPAVNGTEQRRAYVYLPTMYEAQPERRFPVLYLSLIHISEPTRH